MGTQSRFKSDQNDSKCTQPQHPDKMPRCLRSPAGNDRRMGSTPSLRSHSLGSCARRTSCRPESCHGGPSGGSAEPGESQQKICGESEMLKQHRSNEKQREAILPFFHHVSIHSRKARLLLRIPLPGKPIAMIFEVTLEVLKKNRKTSESRVNWFHHVPPCST